MSFLTIFIISLLVSIILFNSGGGKREAETIDRSNRIVKFNREEESLTINNIKNLFALSDDEAKVALARYNVR